MASEELVDWADVLAFGIVAAELVYDAGMLAESEGYAADCARRVAAALRSAYAAGQRDARPESAAARRARFGWEPLTDEQRGANLDRALDEVTR